MRTSPAILGVLLAAAAALSSAGCVDLAQAAGDPGKPHVGIVFEQTPIVESVAKDYPDVRFAIVDGVSQLPNVASLIFKEHEGSYLVGMIAARPTKTGPPRVGGGPGV